MTAARRATVRVCAHCDRALVRCADCGAPAPLSTPTRTVPFRSTLLAMAILGGVAGGVVGVAAMTFFGCSSPPSPALPAYGAGEVAATAGAGGGGGHGGAPLVASSSTAAASSSSSTASSSSLAATASSSVGGASASSSGSAGGAGGAGGAPPECTTPDDCGASTTCSPRTCLDGVCGRHATARGTACDETCFRPPCSRDSGAPGKAGRCLSGRCLASLPTVCQLPPPCVFGLPEPCNDAGTTITACASAATIQWDGGHSDCFAVVANDGGAPHLASDTYCAPGTACRVSEQFVRDIEGTCQ